MVEAMLVAHLLGDYVFQWNQLAKWKSESWRGVLLHGLIVLAITVAAARLVDPAWTLWAIVIGTTHLLIDGLHFHLVQTSRRVQAVSGIGRFATDQVAHLTIIGFVLSITGWLDMAATWQQLSTWMLENPLILIVYVAITMPSWIVVEYVANALVLKQSPTFHSSVTKYVGILERLLMTTFTLIGQVPLAFLVPVPRLVVGSWQRGNTDKTHLHVVRVLLNLLIAIGLGYAVFLVNNPFSV